MPMYEIVFRDEVKHESMDECIEVFLEYLQDCVRNGDVSAFQFYKLPEGAKDERG